jgi:hypothetical protein
MGGEGSVLNALRTGLQHLPPQPSPRRIAVNIETRRLVGPNPNAATSVKGCWLYLTSKGASNGYNSE